MNEVTERTGVTAWGPPQWGLCHHVAGGSEADGCIAALCQSGGRSGQWDQRANEKATGECLQLVWCIEERPAGDLGE